MEYFTMNQDPRLLKVIKPVGTDVDKLTGLTHEEICGASEAIILYVKGSEQKEYVDYIEFPIKLISKKLKTIMSKYQKDAVFITVVFIEKETSRQETYYLISAPKISCASEETVYDKNGNVLKFVLDQGKVGPARIFCASENENQLIVRLDVAESILRREPDGIWLERVRTVTKERK